MVLLKNMLLEVRGAGVVYRILDEIGSGVPGDNATTHYVVIDVKSPSAMPQLMGKHKLLDRVADRELTSIDEDCDVVNLANLSPAEKAVVERRWELWQLVSQHGTQLYDEALRGKLADRLAAEKRASKPFFYKVLRLYWQRGGGKASLVTNYPNCGRPGERRIAAVGGPKPGRPRTVQPGAGIAASEVDRANMRKAWSRSPVGKTGKGLRAAYTWMLISCYPEHVSMPSGRYDAQVENYNAVPTFEQFQYHWKTEFSFELRQLNRYQRRRFASAFKQLLTGTLQEVRGPGTRYYIDATILDVYCVSRSNRNRIVGRPTLYVVVDQFSRMVVGIYVGLEPPCWAGAMLAVWNCSVDKVSFAARYGVEIKSEQWPTGYMPVHLMGDRGELTSAQADALAAGFCIDVENSRPYAGDAKGVAERVFGTIQTKFGPYMPGYVDKEFSGRDAEPAALSSAMDIHEITRVMILATLHTNLRVVRDYEGWPEVIASGVPFVPVELWHWGVANLRCDARRYDELYLKKYLWPTHKMRLSRKALQFFRGLYYMCDDLASKPWFLQAFAARESFPVLYHPLEASTALVIPSGERTESFEVHLTRRSTRFNGLALSEVYALENQRKKADASARWKNLPTQAWLESEIHETVRYAKKRAAEQYDSTISKASRLKGIRDNRADEVDAMTSETMENLFGFDPLGTTIDIQATEVSTSEEGTLDAVRKLITQRGTST